MSQTALSEPVAPSIDRQSDPEPAYLRHVLSHQVGEFIRIRRDIHAEPELAFQEHRTAALVAEKLATWGYAVERHVGGTGVVGRLVRGKGTKRIGLRADMDALPIDETSGAPWSSKRPGVMHACGHDGHTAMLLAAARRLAEHGRFDGTLNLVFQPAEEGGGGAVRMIDDGLFERYPCDAVFAMHNAPGVPQGHLMFREGAAMASSDYVTVTLIGVGGHGAMPHRATDPIVAAASIVMALQTVVSRNIDPLQMSVVTVGAIHAGKANNVIPASATLEISVRSLDREVRALLETRIKALIAAQAESFGVAARIDWRAGYSVLVNTPDETAFARRVGIELRGSEGVTLQGPAATGSEDFAFMLERVPGSYLLIGNGNGDGESAGACMGAQPGLRLQRRQHRRRRRLLDLAGRALPDGLNFACPPRHPPASTTMNPNASLTLPTGRPAVGSGGSSPVARQGISKSVVAATVAGNALEFYDFVTYAFFAVYIGKAFFPAATPLGSLLLSVAVFGVGFVSRPIGGVVIGAFADRAGRKPAMLLTIALITIGTLGLALTPSYESIGLAAPIIVVVCRLIQGLALGGEVGPSTAFLIESAPPSQRGLYASWQLASQGAATLVAGLFGVAVIASLTPAELQAWGWRLPFTAGLLLLPVAFYLRRSMPETLHDAPAERGNVGLAGLAKYRGIIVLAIFMVLGGTVSTYVGSYMTTYAITTLKFPPLIAMGATVTVGIATLLFSLLGGWLCDRYGRKPVMLYPRIALAVLTVPAFGLLIDHPTQGMLLAVTTFLAMLGALSGGASLVAIPELLPRRIRATGLSIAYAVGVAIFGGTTQFIVTWLIHVTGNPAAPAWYVAFTSVITAVAMMILPETRNTVLQD